MTFDTVIVPGHNVIFILNDNGIKSHPISRFIEHASELNTTFIFFETEKKYLPLYCSQIVVLEENYSAYTYASENKTDNIWDKIIRELSNIVIDKQDRLISFDNLLKKSDIEMIEEIDKRITFLIELRGRFIIYLLKKHHFTTL